jgi:hypothetical protein
VAVVVYATKAEFEEWLEGDVTPPHPERLLRAASNDLDRVLKLAVYDVDTDGNPTDSDVAESFRIACCWQAALIATKPRGNRSNYVSMTSSKVSWTRAVGKDGRMVPQGIADEAWSELLASGVRWQVFH